MPLSTEQGRQVLVYVADESEFATQHERAGQLMLARQLGALKGFEFGGEWGQARRVAKPYFLPNRALRADEARDLGVSCSGDLYGGVVPQAFVATKAITHGLMASHAAAPSGWSAAFCQSVQPVVLAGISAFSIADGRKAGAKLLERHPLRFKPANARGGQGQVVIRDAAHLAKLFDSLSEEDVAQHGIVLEENLLHVRTCSVGIIEVGDVVASYCGEQRVTRDNQGKQAYGGSSLFLARGGFDDLLRFEIALPIRTAIRQARHYDQAALTCFPGLFASRRNYDIVQGQTSHGVWRSGVLEQSWRLGGASSAEVAALQAFQAKPHLSSLRASSVEVYGQCQPPPEAVIYFQGHDADVGPITKYSIVEEDGHTNAEDRHCRQ